MSGDLLRAARLRAGLSQAELARRAGTSRTTLSAYEHGRVSPTLDTATRILEAADARLDVRPSITWHGVRVGGGRVAVVPSRLPDLDASQAFRHVDVPLHLDWSSTRRVADLADRRQRARLYEVVLREGTVDDVLCLVDGALLVELWPELVLPRAVRAAWQPLIDEVLGGNG